MCTEENGCVCVLVCGCVCVLVCVGMTAEMNNSPNKIAMQPNSESQGHFGQTS